MPILKLNDVNAGVRRPLRVEDIQNVWSGLNSLLASYNTGDTPRILSGFTQKNDGTLSEGVIAFQGQLYYHPDTEGNRIALNNSIYTKPIASDDLRIFADNTEHPFSFDMLVGVTGAQGGVLIGQCTLANLEAWKTPYIGESQLQTAMFTNLSVTASKIASNAISTGKLGTGAVTEPKLADRAVSNQKLADRAVTTAKMDDETVTSAKVDRSLAPCEIRGFVDIEPTSSLGYVLENYLTYNGSRGVWEVPIFRSLGWNPDSAAEHTLRSQWDNLDPDTYASFPQVVNIIMVAANDATSNTVYYNNATNARAVAPDFDTNMYWSRHTVGTVVSQGGTILFTLFKTRAGYLIPGMTYAP